MDISKFSALLKLVQDKKAVSAIQNAIEVATPAGKKVDEIDISLLGMGDGRDADLVGVLEDVGQSLMASSISTELQATVDDTSSSYDDLRGNDLTTDFSLTSEEQELQNGIDPETYSDIVLEQLEQSEQPTQLAEIEQPAVEAGKQIGVARDIELNSKQQEAFDLVMSGRSGVLIGEAGTGKTTSMRAITRGLIDGKKVAPLRTSTKWLSVGVPGAVILSFTNKAVNNIRHAVVDELKSHTITAHKLLEYQPVFYEIDDPEKPGNLKNTMRFEPTRGAHNPLPVDLTFIGWEECSMIGVTLYNLVQEAMPHKHQELFLGDIQQLPPVFGLAVLGFKMLELPVVQLTEIYRQAANSPIITLAHTVLKGDPELFSSRSEKIKVPHPKTGKIIERLSWPVLEKFNCDNEYGLVKFQPWQKSLEEETALLTFCRQMVVWIEEGYYNPQEDIILCPFNVNFGCIEINKRISQYLGVRRGAVVWEVIAGFQKHYLAVGDRVLYDKEDAIIVNISHNGTYMGQRAQTHAVTLDRWGHHQQQLSKEEQLAATAEAMKREEAAVDEFFEGPISSDVEDRVHSASHIVTVRLLYGEGSDYDREVVLESAAEINNLLGGYALTVHKFQGSEADTVFLALHSRHAMMVSRELLYTAITRAKKKLHIICEPNSFERGVKSQRIKGDTLQEKAEWFKGKKAKDEKDETPLFSDGNTTLPSKPVISLTTASIETPETANLAQPKVIEPVSKLDAMLAKLKELKERK